MNEVKNVLLTNIDNVDRQLHKEFAIFKDLLEDDNGRVKDVIYEILGTINQLIDGTEARPYKMRHYDTEKIKSAFEYICSICEPMCDKSHSVLDTVSLKDVLNIDACTCELIQIRSALAIRMSILAKNGSVSTYDASILYVLDVLTTYLQPISSKLCDIMIYCYCLGLIESEDLSEVVSVLSPRFPVVSAKHSGWATVSEELMDTLKKNINELKKEKSDNGGN